MAKVTVSITRTVLGERVTFTAEGESENDANRKEKLLEVSADVRQAVNEYLDTVGMATPPPDDKKHGSNGSYEYQRVKSIVRNVSNGKNMVRVMTTKNEQYGVPIYAEVLDKYMNRKEADVPTEAVDLPGWVAKVHYVGGSPKRVVEIKKHE